MEYINKVKKYYDENPQREWDRLEKNKLEFIITTKYLERYIKEQSVVLDIGGGPGRYSIYFAKKYCKVHLVDLSDANIKFAAYEADKENVKLEEAKTGNAINLSHYPDNYFDAVLNLGPLYHILNEQDRIKAIQESIRVLKPGGIIAIGFISKYGGIYDRLKNDPNQILTSKDDMLSYIENSMHILSEKENSFTDAYFIEPLELKEYMKKFPLKEKHIIGVEGMVSQSEYHIFDKDKQVINEWIDFVGRTAATNAALYGSEHILYIGEKIKAAFH